MSNLTTNAIKEAFFELLSKKSIDQITIKDITSRCGVSRNTFYYHYSDITALLEEIMMSVVDDLIKKYPTVDSLDQGIEVAIEFVLDNKTAVMHIYHSDQRAIYERCLMKLCRYVAQALVNSNLSADKVNEEERELLISYYKCTFFGFIMDWCEDGLKPGYAESFRNLVAQRKNLLSLLLDNIYSQ
jgi:AcrR family transcriptional regulator